MKYLGLSVVGIALAATVATAVAYELYSTPARSRWPAQANNLSMPTVKQRQDLAQLREDLEVLQHKALGRSPQWENAGLFALKPAEAAPEQVKTETKTTAPVKVERTLPSVNVILRSGFQGTAVIDNRVTQVGDSVPGGFMVKAIEAQRVIFLDAAKREVVVELPLNRMATIGATPSTKERP